MIQELKKDIQSLASPEKAVILQRFFKTGKGQYSEGDIFLGIVVPEQRKLAKKYYQELDLDDVQVLLNSKIHEERLIALLILVLKYEKGDELLKEKVVKFYLKNTKNINNWDLVDLSAEKIVGAFFLNKDFADKTIIYELAKSDNLWERRIAMLTTFQFIKNKKLEDALKIAEILLNDKHDLIQKAVGWMLREIGKRDLEAEEEFLQKHYKTMPRTMLRYAIERLDEEKRRFYMVRN